MVVGAAVEGVEKVAREDKRVRLVNRGRGAEKKAQWRLNIGSMTHMV